MPLTTVVDTARLDNLLDIFDQSVQQGLQTGVQQQQAKSIRQWISGDSIGSVEFIAWSKGIINPSVNKSYVTLINVLVVSTPACVSIPHANFLYSIRSAEGVW